jgi:hypothetical protein
LDDAVAVIELARYQEGPASVVVSRDGDDLVFWSSYDDYGKTVIEESRIAVTNFVAKGEGPWPWYDLGDKRDATTCRRRQWRQRQPGDGSRPRARRAAVNAAMPSGVQPIDHTARRWGRRDRPARELAAPAGASQVETALRR